MGSWIAQLPYVFWGFSLVRLAKKVYYCTYNILIMQQPPLYPPPPASNEGDLEHNSWWTVWQDFQIKIFPFLTFCILFGIFHGRNFLTNSDCKYISMNFLQYSTLYPKGKNGMCSNPVLNNHDE